MGTKDETQIVVDSRGFVYVGGVRVARYDPVTDSLYFLDRNRQRCAQRGSREVGVPLDWLTTIRWHFDDECEG